jgi:hypothetical protein
MTEPGMAGKQLEVVGSVHNAGSVAVEDAQGEKNKGDARRNEDMGGLRGNAAVVHRSAGSASQGRFLAWKTAVSGRVIALKGAGKSELKGGCGCVE